MVGPILVAGARDQRRGSAIPASSITQKQQPLTPLQEDPPAPGPRRFSPPAQPIGTKGAGGGPREQGTTEEEMKKKKGKGGGKEEEEKK